ncbi:MAG: hypothetical protein WD872_17470 [Pirellulaceae bacterium]
MSFAHPALQPVALLLVLLVVAAGCRPQDEIARYTVPKPELVNPTSAAPPAAAAQPQQMLGAIVLVGDAGWFFKLTGDPAVVAALEEDFTSFVKTLEFQGIPAEPKWKLAEGWKALPGNQFRHATIEIPSAGKPLELTVTTLGFSAGEEEAYVLANVNRWRDQLNLDNLTAEQLPDHSTNFKVGEYDATLVNLTGTGSGTMSGAPFAGGGPFSGGGQVAGQRAPSVPRSDESPSEISFTKPDNWSEGKLNAFRQAAFEVHEDDKRVEITVIRLSPSPVLANVQRWAGEIGATPVTEADLATLVKKIDVAGQQADYAELVSAEGTARSEMTLGVIVPRGESYWFVKLRGDRSLAEREQANFEAFVKSLKFE